MRLFALVALFSLPVQAQDLLLHDVLVPQDEPAVWARLGDLDAGVFLNEGDGGRVALGGVFDRYAATLHLGGSVPVAQGLVGVSVGAEVAAVYLDLGPYEVRDESIGTVSSGRLSSGVRPQQVSAFVQVRRGGLQGRLGASLDVGSEEEPSEDGFGVQRLASSDGRHALWAEATARPALSATARAHLGLHLAAFFGEGAGHTDYQGFELQALATLRAGAETDLGPVTLGGALLVSGGPNRDLEVGGTVGTVSFAPTVSVGLAPYLVYRPTGSPLALYLKGSGQFEQGEVGFTVAGRNTRAPRLALTLGLGYGL